jgi:signal transduction histidine kinase
MAGLFAVVVVALVAIAISVAYALVLRELRRINANLEQFIKLIVDARKREDARQGDVAIANNAPATRQY